MTMAPSIMTVLLLITQAVFFYTITLIVYRLYFHPLAQIPGPKLAAATSWYEFYYDVIGRGVFCWEIKRMHDKYGNGPIVRINPHEVHIIDTEFYEEIYAPASKKRDKYAAWVVFLGVPTGAFATCPHDHHRLRRRALNLSFSKKAIYETEALIQEKIDRLCGRFMDYAGRGPLRLDAAFFAFTNDVVTEYSFGEGYDCLGKDDFQENFKRVLMSSIEFSALIRHCPWLIPIVYLIPPRAMGMISESLAAVMNWENLVRKRVATLIKAKEAGKEIDGKSVFKTLLDSDLPEEEKSHRRLVDEGKSLMGAGSETTSWTLTLLMWHVMRDARILKTLREELADMPHNIVEGSLLKWLEQKQYLSAVINEALRLNHGAIGRLPRISHEPIRYKELVIPAGTPLSSSNYWVHMDENVFPNPTEFLPERWLEAERVGFPLKKYMVSFSRGTRQCVGQNLATAELYLAAALLVTRFDIEFVNTTDEDILPARDCFVPRPVIDSKGVHAKITNVAA